ncbi:hypothetical protein [Hahella sp. NBU794]|uniref:hypothetical protein n=1 Tax=Hahella sp. NBU794 TaxID=3422590 RepID=UPI003D6FD05C
MKTQDILNNALNGLDYIGYQLEHYGVTDKVNRHTVLAFIMAEQKHIEGELDSISARVGVQKARIERARRQVEGLVNTTLETAAYPLKQTLSLIRSRLN